MNNIAVTLSLGPEGAAFLWAAPPHVLTFTGWGAAWVASFSRPWKLSLPPTQGRAKQFRY